MLPGWVVGSNTDVLTNSVELTNRAELLQHSPSRAAVVQPHRAQTDPDCKLRWLQDSNLLPPPEAGAIQQASTNATKLQLRLTASNGQSAWRDWRETRGTAWQHWTLTGLVLVQVRSTGRKSYGTDCTFLVVVVVVVPFFDPPTH